MSATDSSGAARRARSLDVDPFSTEFFDDLHPAHEVLREAGPLV